MPTLAHKLGIRALCTPDSRTLVAFSPRFFESSARIDRQLSLVGDALPRNLRRSSMGVWRARHAASV